MMLVTGGAGFIGSNLVAALDERGVPDIAVADMLGQDEKWRNLRKHRIAALVPPENLMFWLDDHAGQIDTIFHMGAVSSTIERDADLILHINLTLSQELWRWCAKHGTRLIYASSAATYGNGEQGFDDDWSSEALARLLPLNAYGWSKHLFDRWVVAQVERGLPCPPQWAGMKFFNVFGPNEYHKGNMRSVVAQLFDRIVAGGNPMLFRSHNPNYEDGGQLRDFVAVADCVDQMLWLADHPEISGIFNAGSGKARSFKDLAEAVFRAMGREPDIRYVDTPEEIRQNYQYFTEARMQRVRALGYPERQTTLEDTVRLYVQNYLAAPDRYR